jgi:hypothetical protein
VLRKLRDEQLERRRARERLHVQHGVGRIGHVVRREHPALPRGGVAHGDLHGVQAVAFLEVLPLTHAAPTPEDQEGAAGRHGEVSSVAAGGVAVPRRGRERGHGRGALLRDVHGGDERERVVGFAVDAEEHGRDERPAAVVADEAAEEALVEDAAADGPGRGGAADHVVDGRAPRDDLVHEVVAKHLRRRPVLLLHRLRSITHGDHRYGRARRRARTGVW